MSIKGFPTNQKIIQSTSGITSNFATVIPTDEYRNALEIPRFSFRVDSATVPRTAGASTGNADSGPTVVVDTATPAKVGDVCRFEDGDAAYIEVPIVSVSVNGFILAARLNTPPAAGDTFYILRSVTQRTGVDGSQLVTVTPSPVAFVLNGVDTEVEQDTGTPANSIPLPVIALNPDGTEATLATEASLVALENTLNTIGATQLPATLGQLAMAASLSVTMASDQTAIPVSGPLTDVQLRATAVPVSAASLPLPTGAATEVTLAAAAADLALIEAKDFATQTTLAAAAASLATIAAEDFATETTLAAASAKLPATLGQKAMTASMAVTIASDQASIPVAATLAAETTKVIGTVNTKSPVNTNGSIVNTALTATTASSASAPGNAVGFIISAAAANDQNIRWCIGGTASTTVGTLFEPGRDSGFIPCAATISVCAVVSGTNAFAIQWILSA